MEQVRRIELPSQPWQGRILATEPHLQYNYYIKKNKDFNKKLYFMLNNCYSSDRKDKIKVKSIFLLLFY